VPPIERVVPALTTVANAPLLELKSKVLIVFVPEVEVVGVTVSETVDAVAGAAQPFDHRSGIRQKMIELRIEAPDAESAP